MQVSLAKSSVLNAFSFQHAPSFSLHCLMPPKNLLYLENYLLIDAVHSFKGMK